MKSPEAQGPLDRAVVRIATPIEAAAATFARAVSNVYESYVYLVDVKRDNERLAYDNARLREQVHSLEQALADNRLLRRLLQLRDATLGETISAQVIGRDFTEFFRVTRITLDRGARDLRPHMPVVAPDGVVGAILHADPGGNTADVQLAVDAAFGVDV